MSLDRSPGVGKTQPLREEVVQEALVRKIEGFSRFIDIAAQLHAMIPNMARIAKAAGISEKTVAAYFQHLEVTLMSWRLLGWSNGIATAMTPSQSGPRGELNLIIS
jgi:predicted AAA+ superfamily ATPase